MHSLWGRARKAWHVSHALALKTKEDVKYKPGMCHMHPLCGQTRRTWHASHAPALWMSVCTLQGRSYTMQGIVKLDPRKKSQSELGTHRMPLARGMQRLLRLATNKLADQHQPGRSVHRAQAAHQPGGEPVLVRSSRPSSASCSPTRASSATPQRYAEHMGHMRKRARI